MNSRSQQLIYKGFNRVFGAASNTLGSQILALYSKERCYKKSFFLASFSGCTVFKPFTSSSFPFVSKEYKTLLPASKKVRIDISCDLKVKPIDSESKHLEHLFVRAFCSEICNYNIDFVESEEFVTIIGRLRSVVSSKEIKTVPLEIEIPINHDVEVISEQGNVSISNIRSDNMTIKVTNGSIKCKDLHCASMLFDCLNGSVNCEGVLQGNTDIKIRNHGNFNGLNFQGGYLKVETEHGDIYVASTYCNDSTFLATEGNLFLKNIHKKNHVLVKKGNINIAGLDGTLDAQVKEGNINVQVTQLNGNSYLEAQKGNVILSMEKEDLCLFDLSGKSITLKDNLESIGEINHSGKFKVFKSFQNSNSCQPTMKVVCNEGDVILEKKSWISSIISGSK